MNMDLDAATKEAPTLTLDPFCGGKGRDRGEEAGVGGRAGGSRDGTDTGRTETGG